jgi:hypothetical protein
MVRLLTHISTLFLSTWLVAGDTPQILKYPDKMSPVGAINSERVPLNWILAPTDSNIFEDVILIATIKSCLKFDQWLEFKKNFENNLLNSLYGRAELWLIHSKYSFSVQGDIWGYCIVRSNKVVDSFIIPRNANVILF